MIDFKEKEHYTYADLLQLVQFLRQPGGCPWDSAQDHHSIRRCFLEETAEACEAIDENDAPHLQEELGDVLYQVVFHADLEREAGRFSMDDVIDGICKKLIARHPFLFGASGAARPDETQALEGWEARKRELRGNPTIAAQMQDVCKTLPGLWRAEKLCKKAATLDPQTAQAAGYSALFCRPTGPVPFAGPGAVSACSLRGLHAANHSARIHRADTKMRAYYTKKRGYKL